MKVKNRNVISESDKAYSVKVDQFRILQLPKSQIIQVNKTERETTFILTDWMKEKIQL